MITNCNGHTWPGSRGWIGYDGRCPFCQRVVAHWRNVFESRGFRFVPLQDPAWTHRPGLDADTVDQEMTVWNFNQPPFRGATAWCYLARRIPWLWPVGVLGATPGLRWVTRSIYRWIGKNRHCLGDLCLPNTTDHRCRTTTFLELP